MGTNQPVSARAFDFSDCLVVFDNVTLVGVNSINASHDNPATTDDVGADGSVVVFVSNDERGTIEVEFQQSSPSIDYLSQQVQLFRATKQFKVARVDDLNGTSKAMGERCWVEKVADVKLTKEKAERTFRIRVANLRLFAGGINDR